MQASRVLRAVKQAERICRCYWKGMPPSEWNEAFFEGQTAAYCYAAEHPRARTATIVGVAKRAMDAYLYRWNRDRQSIQRLKEEWGGSEDAACTALQWWTEDLSEEEGRRMDVRAALARLPLAWQQVIVAAYIEEHPLAVIAARMGRSLGATKQPRVSNTNTAIAYMGRILTHCLRLVLLISCSACRWFTPSTEPTVPSNMPILLWHTPLIEKSPIDFPFPIVNYMKDILVYSGQIEEGVPRLIGLSSVDGSVRWIWGNDLNLPCILSTDMPVIYNGQMLLTTGKNRYCINIQSGLTVWQSHDTWYNLGLIRNFPNSSEYVGEVSYYDINGNLVYAIIIGDLSESSAEVVREAEYPKYIRNVVHCLHGQDAHKTIVYCEASKVPDTTLYAVTVQAVAYDINCKKELFRIPIHTHARSIPTVPCYVIGNKYYVAVGRRIACIDIQDAKLLWYQNFPGDFLFSGFIIVDGTIYANCEDTYLYALDAETGLIKWKEKSSGTNSRLFYMGGLLYFVGGGDGKLHAVDAATGKHLWKIDPPERNRYGFATARPTGFDGRLYVTSWTTAYCYRVK